jgi:alpha-N-arabinofuranosidase
MEVKTLPQQTLFASDRDEFTAAKLALPWNFVRNLDTTRWSLTERKGWLRLKGAAVTLEETEAPPVFIGQRQKYFESEITTAIDFQPAKAGEEAGLALRMNNRHHYEFGIARDGEQRVVYLRYVIGSIRAEAARKPLSAGPVRLRIISTAETYRFAYANGDEAFHELGEVETRYLSSEVADGFTGVFIGMFATGTGRDSSAPADFDWFEYKRTAKP